MSLEKKESLEKKDPRGVLRVPVAQVSPFVWACEGTEYLRRDLLRERRERWRSVGPRDVRRLSPR